MEIRVKLSGGGGGGSIDQHVVAHVVAELIKYILYMHSQMPRTYDEIQRELLSQNQPPPVLHHADHMGEVQRSSTTVRAQRQRARQEQGLRKKRLKFLKSLDGLLASVRSGIFSLGKVQRVFMLLGSHTRPKEVYVLHLPCILEDQASNSGSVLSAAPSDAAAVVIKDDSVEIPDVPPASPDVGHLQTSLSDGSSEKREKRCKIYTRKIIRALLAEGSSSTRNYGPMKLHVILQGDFRETSPNGFVASRENPLKMAKAHPVELVLESGCAATLNGSGKQHTPMECSYSVPETGIKEDETIWYRCRATVKGLRNSVES